MEKHFQFILTTSVLVVLTACGGGGEPAPILNIDSYIGSWRSACHSYVANGGAIYYTHSTLTITKMSPIEISMAAKDENAYADNTCTVLVYSYVANFTPAKLTFGTKAFFAGKIVDEVVYDDSQNAELSGYILVEGNKLYFGTNSSGRATSGSGGNWGANSLFTKL